MHTPKSVRKDKSFYIKTFGCQMNYHDTERMSALMAEQGYSEADSVDSADTIIFNTCSIRDKAHHKGVSGLGHFRKVKANNPKVKLGFAGCVAQHDGENVLRSFPFLDFVLGTDNLDALPEVLYRVDQGESKVMAVGFDPSQDYSIETKIIPGKKQAFVNIMKGCDNFCTYCIVPFTRGREKSRTVEEIVVDIEKLLRQGVIEITLLGQNVNSFGKSLGGKNANQTFARLLREVEAMADRLDAEGITNPDPEDGKPLGLLRLRYTTSNPKDFDEDMMEAHRDLKRLVPHLHLPVQSGSPEAVMLMVDLLKDIRTEAEESGKLEASNYRAVKRLFSTIGTVTHPEARREVNRCVKSENRNLADEASQSIRVGYLNFLNASPYKQLISDTYALRKSKDYEAAIKGYTEVLKNEPLYYSGYISRSSLFMRMGAHQDAMADLKEADKLNPEDPTTESNIAIALIRLGKIEEGIAEAHRVMDSIPELDTMVRRDAIYNAACVYGRAAEATSDPQAKATYLAKGVDLLKDSVNRKGGFDDSAHFLDDADLNAYHDHESWDELVKQVRKNEASQQKPPVP